jgi:hypothetical protein
MRDKEGFFEIPRLLGEKNVKKWFLGPTPLKISNKKKLKKLKK